MKRYGNLWPAICSEGNVRDAVADVLDTTLSKMHRRQQEQGDSFRPRISETEALDISARFDEYVGIFKSALETETYRFGELTSAVVYEPKKRCIDYPVHLADRIYHHCLVNVTGPLIISKLTADTYGCIKGRGLTQIADKIQTALRIHSDWYYVKTDFVHYYKNVRHDFARQELEHVFKDRMVLRMFDSILDTFSPGLAIGVFPSAYIANLYLSPLDHYMKEGPLKVEYYFRYMDDIVCLVPDKQKAHSVVAAIREFGARRGLEVKNNVIVAPVSTGIHTCGYVFFPDHTRLRKSIKEEMKRSVKRWRYADDATFKLKLASHYGWCSHADCRHLVRSVLGDKYYIFKNNMEYKRLSDLRSKNNWFGLPKEARVSVKTLFGREIIIFEMLDVVIKGENKIAVLFAPSDNETDRHYFITRSEVIRDRLAQAKDDMPFIATVKEEKNYYTIE